MYYSDPLPIDSEPRGFVSERALKTFDPLPLAESGLQKFAHVFEEKQRVRVKETGQKGVLEGINAHKGHMVRLDSGHLIECRNEELEPSDWNAGRASGAQDYAREEKIFKSWDPLPLDSNLSGDPHADDSELSVVGFAKALKAGTISETDRAAIRAEIESRGDGFLSATTLDALCLKYAGGGERFEKRARTGPGVEMDVYDPLPV